MVDVFFQAPVKYFISYLPAFLLIVLGIEGVSPALHIVNIVGAPIPGTEGVIVLVGVFVGVTGGVFVGVIGGVFVGVIVGVFVEVFAGVFVGVIGGVFVGVIDGVLVFVTGGVFVGVLVKDGVTVGVGSGGAQLTYRS